MPDQLLTPDKLARSSVVANCTMNRERQLRGSNSYERELGVDILTLLSDRARHAFVAWFDLCCGTGRALVEACKLRQSDQSSPIRIEGIDLAGMFVTHPYADCLSLQQVTVEDWEPRGPYMLATCVHGLHYIGDKLGAIAKIVASLAPDGILLANLDLANFRFADGTPAGRSIAARLRRNGLQYDSRRHLLRCEGARTVTLGLNYLGADDTAGPNYTRQPAVDSYYDE
jgi:hypothetical protein